MSEHDDDFKKLSKLKYEMAARIQQQFDDRIAEQEIKTTEIRKEYAAFLSKQTEKVVKFFEKENSEVEFEHGRLKIVVDVPELLRPLLFIYRNGHSTSAENRVVSITMRSILFDLTDHIHKIKHFDLFEIWNNKLEESGWRVVIEPSDFKIKSPESVERATFTFSLVD